MSEWILRKLNITARVQRVLVEAIGWTRRSQDEVQVRLRHVLACTGRDQFDAAEAELDSIEQAYHLK